MLSINLAFYGSTLFSIIFMLPLKMAKLSFDKMRGVGNDYNLWLVSRAEGEKNFLLESFILFFARFCEKQLNNRVSEFAFNNSREHFEAAANNFF